MTVLLEPEVGRHPAQKPLELAVLSGSPVVRLGVRTMLAPYRHRVRTTAGDSPASGPAPVADVLLVDPGPCVCAAVRVAAGAGSAAVLLYGRGLATRQVQRALRAGCAGHVDLRAAAVELLRAVEAVGLQPRPARGPGPATRLWPGGEHGLSRRESHVMGLITAGLTNEAIAEQVGLSPNTVKSYIRSAYRKVGVTRRTEAVRWGVEHGVTVAPGGPTGR